MQTTPTRKKTKEAARSPLQKPERTPPLSRRLSIENGTANDRKGVKTPSLKPTQLAERTPPHSTRLSIENGTTEGSTNHDYKKGASIKPPSRRLSLEGPRNVQKTSNGGSLLDLSNQRAPLSPLTSVDTATMKAVPLLQTPKTPEQQVKPRNMVQTTLRSDRIAIETPCRTQGKGSHIRKSLRTIGKFINGSDRR